MDGRRRGQGSLEFLMTYGWVILILLVALVVMWQWGLFSLGQKVEPGSFGFWGLTVQSGTEFILHENGQLDVGLVNGVGANVTVLYANVTISTLKVDTTPCDDGTVTPSCLLRPGERGVLTVTNANWGLTAGQRFEAAISLGYNDTRTGPYVYQSSGRIWGNIEP